MRANTLNAENKVRRFHSTKILHFTALNRTALRIITVCLLNNYLILKKLKTRFPGFLVLINLKSHSLFVCSKSIRGALDKQA